MQFFGHSESITAGCFSHDGKALITASEDTSVRVWDLKNQKSLYTIKGVKYHKAPILTMVLAKKKSIIATGSLDCEIAVANYENANVYLK
jgi:WD40 repeat protein